MLLEIGLSVCTVFLYIYYEVTKQYDYFNKLGIPYCKPTFPFGSNSAWKVFTGAAPLPQLTISAVEELPRHKVHGCKKSLIHIRGGGCGKRK